MIETPRVDVECDNCGTRATLDLECDWDGWQIEDTLGGWKLDRAHNGAECPDCQKLAAAK